MFPVIPFPPKLNHPSEPTPNLRPHRGWLDTSPALVNAVVTDLHDASFDAARIYDDEGEFAVEIWVDAQPSIYSSH